MKKIATIFFIITLYWSHSTNAQNPSLRWQEPLGGLSADYAASILATSDGNFFVTGFCTSADGNITDHDDSVDAWMVKINTDGKVLQKRSYGGSGNDFVGVPASMSAVTGGQFYYVTGTTSSNDGDATGNHGSSDRWILKIKNNLSIVWTKELGGSGFDNGNSVLATSDGGCIAVGRSNSVDGQVSGNHGDYDLWVTRLNKNGGLQWQKSYGGSAFDNGLNIIKTLDGNYLIVGRTSSSDGDVTFNHGSYDVWVLKINPSGNLLWQKTYGGSGEENGYGVVALPDGGYLISGSTFSNDGDVTGLNGGKDAWVLRIDGNGNLLWQKTYGSSGFDESLSLYNAPGGGFLFAGTSDAADGDVTESFGGGDMWAVKIDTAGTIIWQKSLGGSLFDRAFALAPTADNGEIIVGDVYSNDAVVCGNHGTDDYAIMKITNCTLLATITPMGSLDICSTGSVKLIANAGLGFTYQWYRNNTAISGATKKTYTASIVGCYTVVITNGSGCAASSLPANVFTSCKLENEMNAVDETLEIFPNPNHGQFTLLLNDLYLKSSTGSVKIYNAFGMIIYSEDFSMDETNSAVIQMPASCGTGVYFLQLRYGVKTAIKKILIE